jgi:hypothetical protein
VAGVLLQDLIADGAAMTSSAAEWQYYSKQRWHG